MNGKLTSAEIENRIYFGGDFTRVEQYDLANEVVRSRTQVQAAKELAEKIGELLADEESRAYFEQEQNGGSKNDYLPASFHDVAAALAAWQEENDGHDE